MANDEKILGAISIRPNAKNGNLDGYSGYGIRPSERKKGFAKQMLEMALPIMKSDGINPVVITCDKNNVGSAKTIIHNGGILTEEVIEKETGNVVQLYHILL